MYSNIGHHKNRTEFTLSLFIDGHHADKFPKFVGVKQTVSHNAGEQTNLTYLNVKLAPVKGNARNDAGFKRLVRFVEVCKANGFEIAPPCPAGNKATIEEVLAAY